MKLNDGKIINNTIGNLMAVGYDELKSVGIDSYILDTQLLLAKVLEKDKLYIITNRDVEIQESEVEWFLELISLRKTKKPMKYILGHCEFMGIDLFVKEGVLIPRPDTEVLVEEAIKEIKKKGYSRICDVCSGSGAIGLAIASYLHEVKVEFYDISEDAENVNKENIRRLDLSERAVFYRSNLLQEALENNKSFDVIISNPPYIKEAVIPALMEDVRDHEPYIALWGGEDGLDFYRKITEQSILCLVEGGLLAYEVGHDQGEEVQGILKANGFSDVRCIKDLSGHDRVVLGVKS